MNNDDWGGNACPTQKIPTKKGAPEARDTLTASMPFLGFEKLKWYR